MSLENLLYTLLIGALAGWLGGLLTKGKGFGLVGNIIVGIVGAVIGRFLFGVIGISASSQLGQLIFAVVGALIFIYLLQFIKK